MGQCRGNDECCKWDMEATKMTKEEMLERLKLLASKMNRGGYFSSYDNLTYTRRDVEAWFKAPMAGWRWDEIAEISNILWKLVK